MNSDELTKAIDILHEICVDYMRDDPDGDKWYQVALVISDLTNLRDEIEREVIYDR